MTRPLSLAVGKRGSSAASMIASVVAVLILTGHAVLASAAYSPFSYGVNASGLQWFDRAKFGMFMHFGPVTQWGTEISFPLVCTSLPCKVQQANKTVVTITTTEQLKAHRLKYAALSNTFNPSKFNATFMAELAKSAGFKYLMYTTVHCDGFLQWNTSLSNYSIVNTPFGRDTFGELHAAFKSQGLRVGAYMCPSLWNNNDYWQPDASTALGPVCQPNYSPSANPKKWGSFIGYLHSLVHDLTQRYAPDAFWFDCYNSPPTTDTYLDQVLQDIRNANPDSVINTRNGIFSDYMETTDQSESLAENILGKASQTGGVYFEIPSVLQTSHQWAFDPFSGQKPASLIISNLALLTAKGGNYLLNVAPGPDGQWAPAAIDVLRNLTTWFDANAEAIHDTEPSAPYEYDNMFVTSKPGALYVTLPAVQPGTGTTSPVYSALRTTNVASGAVHPLVKRQDASTNSLLLPWIRKGLLKDTLVNVTVLGGQQCDFELTKDGLVISYTVPMVPLRSYYSPINQDVAPCATRSHTTCSIYTEDNYALIRTEGYCAPSLTQGLVKAELFFSSELVDNTLANTTTKSGYEDVETECYVFAEPGAGRAPLDVYWNAERKDEWVVGTDASRSAAKKEGYVFRSRLGYCMQDVPPHSPAEEMGLVFRLSFKPG